MRSPELDLEVYQGPFDLLLSLIMKEEVDLLEVPLVEVITAYLDDMEAAGVVGYWDDMTEFLLLMSLLVEVKSRMLLPEAFLPFEEDELTPEQARDQLLDRLFIYSRFKAAAVYLRELGEANSCTLMRGALGEKRVVLPSLGEISLTGEVGDLQEALQRVLTHKGDPDTSHLPDARVQLRRQIALIRDLLTSQASFSFNKVFGAEQPLVQALSIFALLDMVSRGEVRVQQPDVFGDIVVKTRQTKELDRRSGMTDQGPEQVTTGIRLADLRRDVEALLFASGEPLNVDTILQALGAVDSPARRAVEQVLDDLAQQFPPEGERGFELVQLAGGWAFGPIPCRRLLSGPCSRSPPKQDGCRLPPWNVSPSSPTCNQSVGHRSLRYAASTPTRPSATCSTANSFTTSAELKPGAVRFSTGPRVASKRCSAWPRWTTCPRSRTSN